MRGLGKFNELEDIIEPPLGGHQEASILRLPRDDPLDMEADDATLEEEEAKARFSPGESQIGLL